MSIHLSVKLFVLLTIGRNHWMKFQPNVLCELLTRMGRATAKKKSTPPGAQGQISLKFNKKVNFKPFLYQTSRVLIQIEKNETYQKDLCSDAWVMPQGGTLGARDAKGVKYLFRHSYVSYQIDGGDG